MQPQKVLNFFDAQKKKKFQLETYFWREKKDGWYVTFDVCEGKYRTSTEGNLISSSGRLIPSMQEFSDKFRNSRLFNIKGNIRLVFEAVIPELDFHTMNGIFNRKYEQVPENTTFWLHDVIYLDDLEIPAFEREKSLQKYYFPLLQDSLGETVQYLQPQGIVSSLNEIMKAFHSETEKGNEGIVLKQCSSGYFPGKRNTSLMKLKEEVTLDLPIVSWFWSRGEKGNEMMNLVVLNGQTRISVSVPKFEDQNYINNNDPIGEIVEIKAMELLPGGNLREPRFKRFRKE